MKNNYCIKLALWIGVLFFSTWAKAQLNYPVSSFQNISGTYSDLGTSGSSITVANSNDANSASLPIGFTFTYNGSSFTDFIFNTNGVIKLGTTAPSTAALYTALVQNSAAGTGGIFNISDPNMIAPFQLDLVGTASVDFRYATTGSVGARVCTIQWKNVTENSTTPAVQFLNFSFQCKLYEGTNIIEFVYGAATPSTSASVFKAAQVGLKGTSTLANQLLTVTKGSTQAWNLGSAVAGNYTGNNFNYGNNVGGARPLPVPGVTLRFVPIYGTDIAIRQVYSMGKLPIPFGAPHTVKAAIKNAGTNGLTNVYVKIKVSGVNTVLDSVLVTGINASIDTTITFPSYTPLTTGTNIVKVFVDADNNVFNDTNYYTQIVNLNTYNYADPTVATAGGVGFTGATGDFVAKFPYTGSNSINQIGVNFSVGGTSLRVGIWDTTATGTPGTLLWQSNSFVTLAGLNTIPVNPPIPIGGTFFVGVRQTGTVNASFSFQNEAPIRGSTFYYTSPTGATAWTDFLTTNSNFRFMIEPRLQLANDLGFSSIITPCNALPAGQNINPISTVFNYGSNTQFAVKSRCRIYNSLTNAVVYNDSSNIAFILPGQSLNITYPTVLNTNTTGTYIMKTWSELAGDGDANNDTATKTFIVQALTGGVSSGTRIQFDGVDDYISIPNDPSIKPGSAFTIETWVRPSSLVSIGTLYSKDSTTTDTSLTINMVGATPQVVMQTNTGAYVDRLSSVSGVLNSWTHIALTYNGTNLLLYVNGEIGLDTIISGAVISKDGPICLGRRAGLTSSLNAGLENYYFWNVARTTSQIRLGMHTKIAPISNANLIQYLRFDEGVNQSVLADASGNCNEAYMTNFDLVNAWFVSSLPLDTTLSTSVTFTNSSSQSFAGKNLSMNFQNMSGSHEVVVQYIKFLPLGFIPDTVINSSPKTSHNRHWVIYKYGTATYDSAYATFQLPGGNLGAAATASQLNLAVRDNGASGLWTLARNPADAFSVPSQTVSFWLPSTNTFAKQYGIASSGTTNPLPVTYAYFKGIKTVSGVQLNWATATETNSSHFILERSKDGINFDPIAKIKASGSSNKLITYNYMDKEALSLGSHKLFYRLNQVDLDGVNELSPMISILFDEENEIVLQTIQPNPFNDQLSLVFNVNKDINLSIELINMEGKTVLTRQLNSEAGQQRINLDEAGSLPHGIYFMRLAYNGKSEVYKLVKLRN